MLKHIESALKLFFLFVLLAFFLALAEPTAGYVIGGMERVGTIAGNVRA